MPCVTFGKTMEAMGKQTCIMGAILMFVPIVNLICWVQLRGEIREKYGIEVSYCQSLHLFSYSLIIFFYYCLILFCKMDILLMFTWLNITHSVIIYLNFKIKIIWIHDCLSVRKCVWHSVLTLTPSRVHSLEIYFPFAAVQCVHSSKKML